MSGLKSIPTNVVNPDSQDAINGPLAPTQVLIIVSTIPRPRRVAAVARSVCVIPQSVWPLSLLSNIFVATTDNAKAAAFNIENAEWH